MRHRVKYMSDELMGGRDWLLCDQHDDGVTLFIRQGARKLPNAEMERVLEEAWSGYRKLQDIPEQREPVSERALPA